MQAEVMTKYSQHIHRLDTFQTDCMWHVHRTVTAGLSTRGNDSRGVDCLSLPVVASPMLFS